MTWNDIKRKFINTTWREFVVKDILRTKFIINDSREFGVRILGINCYYYKRSSPIIYDGDSHDDGGPMLWREVSHREYGESLTSPYNFESNGVNPKYPQYGEEYKLHDNWDLINRYPIPKFVIEDIRRNNKW